MKTHLSLLVLALFLACGCAPRTVLIPPGTPVRLAEPVDARIWVKDGSGTWIKGADRVELPEGAYVVTLPATRPGTLP